MAAAQSLGERSQHPSATRTRPPGRTTLQSAFRVSRLPPQAWEAPTHRTRLAGAAQVGMSPATKVTRSDRPRPAAASRPRCSAQASRSTPTPLASGPPAIARSRSSPHPHPRSSTSRAAEHFESLQQQTGVVLGQRRIPPHPGSTRRHQSPDPPPLPPPYRATPQPGQPAQCQGRPQGWLRVLRPDLLAILGRVGGRAAAAGTSSKEIARILFVSVRTVENHLLHVYTKLGVRRPGRGSGPFTLTR